MLMLMPMPMPTPMDRPPKMTRHSRRTRTTVLTTSRQTMIRRLVKQPLSATRPPDRQQGKRTPQQDRQQDKIMPPQPEEQQEQQPEVRPPAQLCSRTVVSRRMPSLRTSTCWRAPSSLPS